MNSEKYFSYAWKYTKSDLKFCPRCGAKFVLEDIHVENQPQLVCDSCKFIFYLDSKLVACPLVTNNGKVLLLRRNEKPRIGKWALPGGHVERGDDVFETARREALEEAGINTEIGAILKIFSLPESGIVQIVFIAQTNEIEIKTNIESMEGKWFAIQDIPWEELAFETTKTSLEEFIRISEVK